MSCISHLRCTGCGEEYPADTLMNLCPADQRPVEIVMDLERLLAERPDDGWYLPDRRDMWRFGAVLPLDIADPEDRAHIVTLGEGHTPLLGYPDHPLARRAGFNLRVKDEGKAHPGFGANPTQSFKDRGMAMAISMARKAGLRKLAIPTQGNAGDSLCEYAEHAGLEAVVAMPDNTPMPILGRVAALASRSERFHLELVEGTIREAGELLKRDWIPEGWFSAATFQEPGWRIDGKKTLGLELAEPGKQGGDWSLPDVVIYPTGGGTGVLGMWKAWNELECLGLLGSKRPRMVCVQSDVTQPLVTAWETGAEDTVPEAAGETLAYGVNVPGGVGHFRVLEIIRASGGAAVAVPEPDIHSTLSETWKSKGWWICPEGAACLAALPVLLDSGMIRRGDEVVVFNTGSLEKYLPDLRHL
ncbi:MAG: threonine synthase, partial [Xanthomonadales bacterium]|nr:threonine synthase [Xanthomonadales bacterium]NIX12389.1 threonine synthase [Xanthomonadales bacterium]